MQLKAHLLRGLTPIRCPPLPPRPEDMAKSTSQQESIAAETEALKNRLADLSGDVSRQVGVNQYQETQQLADQLQQFMGNSSLNVHPHQSVDRGELTEKRARFHLHVLPLK